MNAKERVMCVLNHQRPDRMPCFGANSTVIQACESTIADSSRILAPGCTVAPETPLENLQAMVEVAKKH